MVGIALVGGELIGGAVGVDGGLVGVFAAVIVGARVTVNPVSGTRAMGTSVGTMRSGMSGVTAMELISGDGDSLVVNAPEMNRPIITAAAATNINAIAKP